MLLIGSARQAGMSRSMAVQTGSMPLLRLVIALRCEEVASTY